MRLCPPRRDGIAQIFIPCEKFNRAKIRLVSGFAVHCVGVRRRTYLVIFEVVDLFVWLFYIKYVAIRGISSSLLGMTRLISPVLSSFSLPQIARDEPGSRNEAGRHSQLFAAKREENSYSAWRPCPSFPAKGGRQKCLGCTAHFLSRCIGEDLQHQGWLEIIKFDA